MDPQAVFCHNSACPARGQVGQGNIRVHSRKERRYRCDVCGCTFAATAGTVFYRRRLSKDTVVKIITLLAHGCPRQAIVAAFEVDERTAKNLEEKAGGHCQDVHEHLVEQPRDLGQVQGDACCLPRGRCVARRLGTPPTHSMHARLLPIP